MALLTEATFTNINTTSVDLLATGTAFRDMSWSYEMAGAEFGKQQNSGQQQGHVFVRKLTITINGLVTGTSASDYWTHRQAILSGFLVDEGAQTATSYKHGRLTITPSGGSQVYADVVVDSDSFELLHDRGVSSEYTVTLRCPDGYWRTTGSSAIVKI